MKKVKMTVLILLILFFGVVGGYILTIYSLFPTCHGHIFAEVPVDLPFGKAPDAVSAHLMLIHNKSLLCEQSWDYVLNVCDAQGKKLCGRKFNSELAGGLCELKTHGNLTWDDDAKSVTVCINDFTYTLQVN